MGDFLVSWPTFASFFAFVLCFSFVYGARELSDDRQHAVETTSLMPASKCSPSTNKGPCSPFAHQSIARSTLSSAQGIKLPLRQMLINKDVNYVVTVGFGTPKRDLTLMFDTGSSNTWIQCQPCIHCYNQNEPIFDPSQSLTFSNSSSQYTQTYYDKSYVSGYFARDTLTIATGVFHDFEFLCGQNNRGSFGKVAGILALGLSDKSLMSQIQSFSSKFCYCLPPTESSTGYLAFGDEAVATCKPQFNIPIVGDEDWQNGYSLSLVGIIIGQNKRQLSSIDGSSPQKAILDSGTPISRLPDNVYSELRSLFQDLMSIYPPATSSGLMDTCYNLEGYDLTSIIPTIDITLHFDEDLGLELRKSVVFSESESNSKVCLAFARGDRTIIGGYQQQNLNILYDISNKEVGFSYGSCGY